MTFRDGERVLWYGQTAEVVAVRGALVWLKVPHPFGGAPNDAVVSAVGLEAMQPVELRDARRTSLLQNPFLDPPGTGSAA